MATTFSTFSTETELGQLLAMSGVSVLLIERRVVNKDFCAMLAGLEPALNSALMERERATMAIAWPHQWAQLAAAPNFATVDLSSLHYVGPETALGQHPTVKTTWQNPMAAYGNTETFTISAIFPSCTNPALIGGSHGTPQPGMTFKVVDPLTGAVMPMGEMGEIAVKGPTLMLGYLGVPLDETLDDEGFFRTGDGGWVDHALDGTPRLFWQGRLNDIIKTGSANVSPLEVDATLRECPGIKLTQTVGVPHDTLGELVGLCCVIGLVGFHVRIEWVRGHSCPIQPDRNIARRTGARITRR